ncbi:MAG: type IV secretory system conjugative DNA transfer family protein [Oscillospiraceae bacterium]
MKQVNWKKILLPNLPYVFIALLCTKLGQAARLAPGADFAGKLLHFLEGLSDAFAVPLPSFHLVDLCVGVAIAAAIRLGVYVKGKNAKKFRKNMEYGSARWGTAEDIRPYVDPVFENNIILTQTESLTMNNRPADPKTARNKNVLIIGGSGSGKTRFWLKPNLMQCTSKKYPVSFVVTDPKGSIVTECGKMLLHYGYRLKILNTINFKKSMHYNPFSYIHSEKDILKLVTALIANTKGEGKAGDDFWVKAETLLYTALIGYIHYEAPEEEQNISTLVEMLNTMEVREDDEEFQNQVDLMFEDLAKEKPEHFAVRQYKKYKLAAGVVCSKRLLNQAVGKSLRTHKHLTGTVIYGYLWNEARDQWLVDPEAAEVVKRIFAMTIEGYGPYQIASKLKSEKVLIPSAYLAQHGEGVNKNKTFKDVYGWGSSTICNILEKREYLGHTINFKTRKHFKDKKPLCPGGRMDDFREYP